MAKNPDIMTIKDLSKYLQLCEITLYRLAKKGQIPGFKVGVLWRFKKSSIDEWIEKRRIQ